MGNSSRLMLKVEPIWVFYKDAGPRVWGYEVLFRAGGGISLFDFFKNFDSESDLKLFLTYCSTIAKYRKRVDFLIVECLNEKIVSDRKKAKEILNKRCTGESLNFFLNVRIDTLLKHYGEIYLFVKETEKITGLDFFIEVTEDGLCQNKVVMLKKMLEKLPLRIVLDDFGKGGANFEVVKELKPDFVKIDLKVVPVDIVIKIAEWLVLGNLTRAVIFEKVEDYKEFLLLFSTFSGEGFYYQGFLFRI